MEDHMHALELTCTRFRLECGDETIRNLRRRLNGAHVRNHRLRTRVQQTMRELSTERSARRILHEIFMHLLKRTDAILEQLATDSVADA